MTQPIKRPRYQVFLTSCAWVLGAIVLSGGVIDAINNASDLISPTIAATLTSAIVISWILTEVRIRKRPLLWVTNSGPIHLRRLGPKPRIALCGILLLTWLGAYIHESPPAPDDRPLISLAIGDTALKYGATNDVVYVVPSTVKDADFATAFLPLYVSNIGSRTAEDVVIAIRFPEAPHISLTEPMKESSVGVKEHSQFKRRSESFEGVDFTFLSVDTIHPGQTFILNEPIELLDGLLGSPLGPALVSLGISAKDMISKELSLNLRCLEANTLEEASLMTKRIIWARAVSNRRDSSFFDYLNQSVKAERVDIALIFPLLRKKSIRGEGFLSDAMHDKLRSWSYNPAPIQYLLAPSREK